MDTSMCFWLLLVLLALLLLLVLAWKKKDRKRQRNTKPCHHCPSQRRAFRQEAAGTASTPADSSYIPATDLPSSVENMVISENPSVPATPPFTPTTPTSPSMIIPLTPTTVSNLSPTSNVALSSPDTITISPPSSPTTIIPLTPPSSPGAAIDTGSLGFPLSEKTPVSPSGVPSSNTATSPVSDGSSLVIIPPSVPLSGSANSQVNVNKSYMGGSPEMQGARPVSIFIPPSGCSPPSSNDDLSVESSFQFPYCVPHLKSKSHFDVNGLLKMGLGTNMLGIVEEEGKLWLHRFPKC